MIEQEKSNQVTEPIKVRIGEPFHIYGDLNEVKSMSDEAAIVKTIPIDVESMGPGLITIVKDYETFTNSNLLPIKTPAGPVRIIRIVEDDFETIDYLNHPFTIEIIVGGKNNEEVSKLNCELSYEEKRFKGYVYQDSMQFEGEKLPTAEITSWIDSDGTRCKVYFPPSQQVLRKISLNLSLIANSI